MSSAEQQQRVMAFLDAAKNGNLAQVKICIKSGVNKESTGNDRWTALHYAVWKRHLDVVKYLIETCQVDTEARTNGGWTALHLVGRWGHLEIVQYLIEACHVDKETKDNAGRTALHWASDNGHLDVVQYLVETCQADKEAKTTDGWTALYFASYNGDLNIVQYLIEIGHADGEVKDKYGWTVLHYVCKQGYLAIVQYLIESRHVDKEARDSYGQSAYDVARMNNKSSVVQYMEKAGANSTTMKGHGTSMEFRKTASITNENAEVDQKTDTAEQWQREREFLDSAKNGNLDKVIVCFNNGIDKNVTTKHGWTALHCATDNGHLNIVQYLIETCHVDMEAKDNYEWTALHIANYKGHLNIVQYLIETCHVDMEAKDNYGRMALHASSYNGHLNVMQYLIEACHVDKEGKDKYGWTALHYASKHGYLEIIQYLIETCHVDKEAKDNDARTALHLASENGHLKIIQYLIETCYVGAGTKDNKKRTAYDVALYFKQSSVAQYLEKAPTQLATMQVSSVESDKPLSKIYDDTAVEQKNNDAADASAPFVGIQLSLKTNAAYKPKSAHKENAFDPEQKVSVLECMEAARKGNFEKVKYCIDNGVDVQATIHHGITVLHMACGNGHLDIVRYLIKNCSINVETKTSIGRTALHDAISNNHLDIVRYLKQTGHVDVEARDNDGWTALHFASRYSNLDTVQFLIRQCHVNIDAENNAGEVAYDVARKDEIKEYLSQVRADMQASTEREVKKQISLTANFDSHAGTGIIIATPDHRKVSLIKHDLSEEWVAELTVSLQNEMQSFVYELSQLGNSHHYINDRRDILDRIVVEKCNTIEERNEQSAILASPLHRDFYLSLQRKLKCMIKSCESLSTGMVGVGGGDFRSFAAQTIHEKGCNVFKETKLGTFIGNAVKWSTKNLAFVPFIDSVGSVFQLIVTLKAEHDRYLGIARVADFATMVCLQQYGTTSLDNAVEKLARWVVRARCGLSSCKFVEDTDEFGKFKQLMLNLLADAGNTPAKEQASKAADCAFAHIMKPDKGSILFDILCGDTFDVGLDEALAASILGINLDDLRALDSFAVTSQAGLSLHDTNKTLRVITANAANVGLNGNSLHTDILASSEIAAKQEAKIQKQDEMIRKLSCQVTFLEKKIMKQQNCRTNYSAGNGLVYANPAEQFKNEITGIQTDNALLDQRLCDQATIIDNLMSRIAELEKPHSGRPRIDPKGGTQKK